MIQGGARKAKTGSLKAVFIPCNRSREIAKQDQGGGWEWGRREIITVRSFKNTIRKIQGMYKGKK